MRRANEIVAEIREEVEKDPTIIINESVDDLIGDLEDNTEEIIWTRAFDNPKVDE